MALKGHTKIELTDVNTGEVQVVEDDNFITDYLDKFVNNPIRLLAQYSPVASVYSSSTSYRGLKNKPLHKYLLGGVLLYSKSNGDEPSKIIADADNVLVAYSNRDAYSGEDSRRGNFNEAESEVSENSVKFVWDFSTDRGNGTIRSVSLTTFSPNSALIDDWSAPVLGYAPASDILSIPASQPDDIQFGVYFSLSNYSPWADITIYRYTLKDSIGVLDTNLIEQTTKILELPNLDGRRIAPLRLSLIDIVELGHIYAFYVPNKGTEYNTDWGGCYCLRIDRETLEPIDTSWTRLNSGEYKISNSYRGDFRTTSSSVVYMNSDFTLQFPLLSGVVYHNGRFYAHICDTDSNATVNSSKIISFIMSDKFIIADIKEIEIPSERPSGQYARIPVLQVVANRLLVFPDIYAYYLSTMKWENMYEIVDDKIYLLGSELNPTRLLNPLSSYVTGTTEFVTVSRDGTALWQTGLYFSKLLPYVLGCRAEPQGQMRMLASPLITINNLSTPINKTASQTMKVTYTITEVEETDDPDTTG